MPAEANINASPMTSSATAKMRKSTTHAMLRAAGPATRR